MEGRGHDLAGRPARGEDGATEPADVLEDVLRPGLAVVFCGTAASAVSARVGAPYAGPGNRFWPMLHATGLTPRLLAPTEFRDAARFGVGLTDLCKTRSGSDLEVGTDAFDVARLAAAVAGVRPNVIAFTSLTAGRAALGPATVVGPQPVAFAGTPAWVLPSPSGRAVRWWGPAPWHALAAALRR